MSYWGSNSQQQSFRGGRDDYHYNYDATSYNVTVPLCNQNVPPQYYPNPPAQETGGNHTSLMTNSANCNFGVAYENGPSVSTSDPGVTSSPVFHSNLTPLAKEFTPGSSSHNTVQNDSKRQGAVKKSTYWNQERRYYGDKKHRNNDSGYGRNRTFYSNPQNNLKDFNKSKEQSKILEDTKRFLQHVKTIEDQRNVIGSGPVPATIPDSHGSIKNKSLEKNYVSKPHSTTSAVKVNKPNGFQKNNNGRNYRNYYKQDYYENDVRGRNFERCNQNESNEMQTNERRKHHDKGNSQKEDVNIKKSSNEPVDSRNSDFNLKKKLDAASQRERLEQLVIRRLLECLVCCERLRHMDQIWSCKQCYHILHLNCTIRWAQSSKLDSGWRCPACQNVYENVPTEYRCYCLKEVNPILDPGALPHSCGLSCGRKGRSCLHNCTLICHPGPCPDCSVMVSKSCGCGATKPIVKCSSTVPITCQKQCNKTLNCDIHTCSGKCHEGECEPCTNVIKQECYCGKEGRKIDCTVEANLETLYKCGKPCEKLLSCKNHKCERNCHAGECSPCPKAPTEATTCPCGKTKLVHERESCLDPIPCCDKTCSKKLDCGQPSAPHLCKQPCHSGPCLPCSETTMIRCRCGHMDKEILCVELTTKADDARCEKKCVKKRLCGKHKCNQLCCIELDHICPLPCNRLLSCGQHRCEEPCHKGRCSPCWRTSFDELYCECGSSVLYPPVACGTRPPPCDQICSRVRTCNHDAMHSCHSGSCPPCTVLTKRWCYGKHEQRSTIPCHQNDFSCGLPCGRIMPCGKHKCQQPCHDGHCRTPCNQPCLESRAECGHPCSQPCHDGPCPETTCKQTVQVTCECGFRKNNRICVDLISEYQNITMAQLASKIEQMQFGRTVDITDLVSGQKRGSLKTLDCNDECRLVERNRRLAIGLQIRNPDLSAKLTPRYSDYMRSWAKKDSKFCQDVHEKLTELVHLAKQSKQKSRAYSFKSMNRDKRHFVHEYCEHFGCDSAAYDLEPNRNVVATAYKDKSWLPSYSLLEIIQRESGQRKVPGPQQLGKGNVSKPETVSLKLPGRIPRPATPPAEYVDYFNNPPE
ncbi:hypothetical protein FQA39_LY03719 [Lamprigera yunnana]|nr:hypothetical protein FQA39_LY03719 [Lamprigera yunnana]